tara:strand:+ start:247 stop:438 length:192 start_codon:yes stop_codon:yes gene_type:complete
MGKFKMKGFRNSPFTAEDYDSLTESEKETLIKKAQDFDEEKEAEDEKLKIHRPQKEDDRGSAY